MENLKYKDINIKRVSDFDNLVKLLHTHCKDFKVKRYGKFITLDIAGHSYDFYDSGKLIGKYSK